MKTRKVLFKRWIKRVATTYGSTEGTNCWEPDFINSGMFHKWANNYKESSAGFGNYTVGLIELFDGTIEQVLPVNIKFID